MSKSPRPVKHGTNEEAAIGRTLQQYIDGANSGRGRDMQPAFHEAATIFGYDSDGLFAGPIQRLFDWNDRNGPATDLEAEIVSIDVVGTVAAVRLELKNWTGTRYTDLFTLLKVDSQWKIISKVFHIHA